jgi:hypothetical protein
MKKGDIVQITDEKHPWFPCLLIVDEVKSWGVQAACLIPKSNVRNDVKQAFNRLKTEQVEVVGKAVISFGESET